MNVKIRAHTRLPASILAIAFSLGACSHQPPPATNTATAPAQKSDNAAAASHRKAIADGKQAARAIARSMGVPTEAAAPPQTPPDASDSDGFAELDWLKMMPPADLESLQHPPPIRHTGATRMKQFGTYDTVAGITNKKIKLPGYVVPIESDDQGRMTEFFFVPFFGACIHVPPPPPNQIVYAHLATPIKTPEIWDPYWLRGELHVETVKNKLAGSAYTMADASLVPYDG